MALDTPPTDTEVLSVIAGSGAAIEPAQLIDALSAHHEAANVIEALQRAIERGKITFNAEGLVVAVRALAHAA